MNLLVCGSRSFTDYNLLVQTLNGFVAREKPESILLLSGGARGADTLAECWLWEHYQNGKLERHPPDYEKYGKQAPLIRNTEMVSRADYVIALYNGFSRGTLDVINKAKRAGLSVKVIMYEEGGK